MKSSLTILVAAFLLSGCKFTSDSPYRIALLGSRMTTVDPVHLSEYNEITLVSQICGRLTSVDENLNVEGDLADSWDISPDRKSYVFKLRNNLKFNYSEKDVLNADDVVSSFERVREKGVATSWLSDVEELSKKSESEVLIKLKNPSSDFLYRLSQPRFCILDHKAQFVDIGSSKIPNSISHYKPVKFGGDEILLEATDPSQKPVIEHEISVRFLNQETAVSEFKAKKLEDISFYLLSDKEISELRPTANFVKADLYWTWIIFLNPKSFPKPSERQNLIEKIKQSDFPQSWGAPMHVSHSVIPFGMRGYHDVPTEAKVKIPESFTCGKKSIRAAAIEGIPLPIRLKDSLERILKANCKVEVVFLEMGKFMEDLAHQKSDIYISGIDTNSIDPIGFYRSFVTGTSDNLLGYSNTALDQEYVRLKDRLPQERKDEDYQELQKIFESAQFGLALGSPIAEFAYAKSVNTVHMNPLGMQLNRWFQIGRK